MAEQRPYRAPGAAAAKLQQVKKYAAVTLGLSFIIVNWMTTQHAAWLMGDSPRLGPGLFSLPWFGLIYAPWKWMEWAWQWRSFEWVESLVRGSKAGGLFPLGRCSRIPAQVIAL